MKKATPLQPRLKSGELSTRWYVVWYDQDGKQHKEYGRINEHKTMETRQAAAATLIQEIYKQTSRYRLNGLLPAPLWPWFAASTPVCA